MATEGGFELGTDGPAVIVTGVDGSPTSLRAAAYAWGQARRQNARLIIVHVYTGGGLGGATPGGAALMRDASEQVVADLQTEIDKAMLHSPVRYTLLSEQGDPYGVLARIADENRADSVVVGASTQAGHKLVGSVAVRLVKAGRWPVTVVP
jgi:nucleotide-binding universal stress UspA family protein